MRQMLIVGGSVLALLVAGAASGKDLRTCTPGDKPCIVESWREYRAGLVEEYRLWFPTALSIARRRDGARAQVFLNTTVSGQESGGRWYRHRDWSFVEYPDAVAAGIPAMEYMAVVWGYRTAIINVRDALLAATTGTKGDPDVKRRTRGAIAGAAACERVARAARRH